MSDILYYGVPVMPRNTRLWWRNTPARFWYATPAEGAFVVVWPHGPRRPAEWLTCPVDALDISERAAEPPPMPAWARSVHREGVA